MCGGNETFPAQDYRTPSCLQPADAARAGDGDLVVESFPMTDAAGRTYPHSRIAYVKGRAPRPVILVHHNYAGLKQFDVDMACFLAKAGYVGIALDSYQEKEGYTYADRNPTRRNDGEQAVDEKATIRKHFDGAFESMNEVLWNVVPWRDLMSRYLEAAFRHPAVEAGLAGAIGYCLGGQAALEQLRSGQRLQAIVTFHGLLNSRPMPRGTLDPMRRLTPEEYAAQVGPTNTYTQGCIVVIENGTADEHVPAAYIEEFKEEMDGQKIDWRLHLHARIPHGFALAPGVTATSYDERSDRRSTLSMLAAFAEAWPQFEQCAVETNACGTTLPPGMFYTTPSAGGGDKKRRVDSQH